MHMHNGQFFWAQEIVHEAHHYFCEEKGRYLKAQGTLIGFALYFEDLPVVPMTQAMVDIQTAVDSSTESLQSSIIKPRFRDEDVLFSTSKVYENEDIFVGVGPSIKYAPPGSNTILFMRSGFSGVIFYTGLRYVLSVFFTLYQYYLWISSNWISFFIFLNSYLWYVLSVIPFPEDASIHGPAATLSSTSVNSKTNVNTTILQQLYQRYDKARLLPTRFGNLILQRSLATTVPRTRMKLRQVTGRLYIPEHVVFIFEMIPLVVAQPPEVPMPYLDNEKHLVIPNKKEVAQVLSRRAEWASMHHTHKAAEKFRVIYESAKCICWAACSGVKIVTIFESNGYAWDDMHKVSTILREELNSLSKPKYQIYDSIKLVNLTTLETIDVISNETSSLVGAQPSQLELINHYPNINTAGSRDLQTIEESDEIEEHAEEFTQLEPTPESIVSSPEEIVKDKSPEQVNTFRTNLTVFFMSNKAIENKQFHKERAKFEFAKKSNKFDNLLMDNYPFCKTYYAENTEYADPDIIYKFCNDTQMPYSLCGYPLSTAAEYETPSCPIFIAEAKPANFPQYMKGLRILNKRLKKNVE